MCRVKSGRLTLPAGPTKINRSASPSAVDILALIDSLNGISLLPIERTDINRSGVASGPDILRLIDLLNGVNTSRPWLGVSLPTRP